MRRTISPLLSGVVRTCAIVAGRCGWQTVSACVGRIDVVLIVSTWRFVEACAGRSLGNKFSLGSVSCFRNSVINNIGICPLQVHLFLHLFIRTIFHGIQAPLFPTLRYFYLKQNLATSIVIFHEFQFENLAFSESSLVCCPLHDFTTN